MKEDERDRDNREGFTAKLLHPSLMLNLEPTFWTSVSRGVNHFHIKMDGKEI